MLMQVQYDPDYGIIRPLHYDWKNARFVRVELILMTCGSRKPHPEHMHGSDSGAWYCRGFYEAQTPLPMPHDPDWAA